MLIGFKDITNGQNTDKGLIQIRTWTSQNESVQSLLNCMYVFTELFTHGVPNLKVPDGKVVRAGVAGLRGVKRTVMIWRSWIETPVGLKLGFIVLLSKFYLNKDMFCILTYVH